MSRLGVLVIHGMGSQEVDFAEKFVAETTDRLGGQADEAVGQDRLGDGEEDRRGKEDPGHPDMAHAPDRIGQLVGEGGDQRGPSRTSRPACRSRRPVTLPPESATGSRVLSSSINSRAS